MKKLILFTITYLLIAFQVSAADIDSAKNEVSQKRQEIKATITQQRAEFQQEMGNLKGTIVQQRTQTREEFKLKLEQIKNERKRALVENISDKIVQRNKRWTDHWLLVLARLDDVLNSIRDKTAVLKNKGVDTSALDQAIANAQTAIDSTRTAVNSQAQKTYIIEIDTEENLRANVGAVISQFQTDLRTVHKLIVNARQAVWNAATELAKIK